MKDKQEQKTCAKAEEVGAGPSGKDGREKADGHMSDNGASQGEYFQPPVQEYDSENDSKMPSLISRPNVRLGRFDDPVVSLDAIPSIGNAQPSG